MSNLDDIKPILERFFLLEKDLVLAIVFGSFARNQVRESSDLDIALLYLERMSPEKRVKVAQSLGSQLNRAVDVLDLKTAGGVILKEALTSGKILLNRDFNALAALMKKFLFIDADFGYLRQKALADRRKRVFNVNS